MTTGPARLPSLSLSLSPLPRPIVLSVNLTTLGREGEGREQVSTPRDRVAQSPVVVPPTVSIHPLSHSSLSISLSLSLSPTLSLTASLAPSLAPPPPLSPPLSPLSRPPPPSLSLSPSLPPSLSLSLSLSLSPSQPRFGVTPGRERERTQMALLSLTLFDERTRIAGTCCLTAACLSLTLPLSSLSSSPRRADDLGERERRSAHPPPLPLALHQPSSVLFPPGV
jgi:hypothetical protein